MTVEKGCGDQHVPRNMPKVTADWDRLCFESDLEDHSAKVKDNQRSLIESSNGTLSNLKLFLREQKESCLCCGLKE